ncbi:integral membrane protein [Whalleya microplaca]|nr:integral membrane protein [Whalleya microplaca]
MKMAWVYNTADGTSARGGHGLTIFAIVLTAASLSAVVLRFYVRRCLVKSVGADDWIVLSAWMTCCGYAVVTIIQTRWGLAMQYVDDIPEENRFMFGVLQYAGWPLYILSIYGFKLSLLVSYFRFIPQGMCRYGVSLVTLTCTLFHIIYFILQFNLCHPVAKQWDPTITDGKCLNAFAFYVSMSSITIIFDFNVMFLPFPILIKSKLPKRKKVVLLGLFALGFFVTVIQIFRIQNFRHYTNYLHSEQIIRWSMAEANLGVICACIPTMSPLIRSAAEKRKRGASYFKTPWGSSGPGSAARWSWNNKNRRQSEWLIHPSPEIEKDPNQITKSDSQGLIISSPDIRKQTDIIITHDPRPPPTAHYGDLEAQKAWTPYGH